MALKKKIEKDIERAKTQIEAYQANLALVKNPDNATKAFLGKANRDMFEITTQFKALESDQEKTKGSAKKAKGGDGGLFGNAGERNLEENKVDLNELKCIPWVMMCSQRGHPGR